MAPPVLASVSDYHCIAVKSSVATESDLVNSLPVFAPTTISPILEVCPGKFTSIDYDAVVDAPIELYPWQREDDACLRQLLGSGPDPHIDWQAMAAQFNQKRGAGDQETEWLQRPREYTDKQAPIARTWKALHARWVQLQKQGTNIPQEEEQPRRAAVAAGASHFTGGASTGAGAVGVTPDGADDDHSFYDDLISDMDFEDACDTAQSLNTMGMDEDLSWDALEADFNTGTVGNLAQPRPLTSKNRKKIRFSSENFSTEDSSDEPGKNAFFSQVES